MNKSQLRAFLFGFILLYFLTLASCYFFYISKINNNPSHITKAFEKNYYAYDAVKQDRMLAFLHTDGEVKAGLVSGFLSGILKDTIQETTSFIADNPSALGFSGTQLSALGENAITSSITSCPTTNDLSLAVEAGRTAGTEVAGDNCLLNSTTLKSTEKVISNPLPVSQNIQFNNSQQTASLLSLGTKAAYYVTAQTDTLVNTNLYAQETLKQIPFVGKNLVYAQEDTRTATMSGILNTVALGNNFFKLWELSRNLAYILIIIPTIALGFAIMFRMQIGPQTQVTLLQSLPQFVIILLLITFSYPISALMVNLAKPVVDLTVSILWSFTLETIGTLGSINFVATIALVILGLVIPLLTGGGPVVIAVVGIFLIFLIVALIRYVFGLFMQAFKLSFIIAFGPLILLTAAFPGRFDTVKNYFLNVASGVVGISAMTISFTIFPMILMWSATINPIVGIAGFFFGCGLLWKSGNINKQVASALGAKPLFELGQSDPRKR